MWLYYLPTLCFPYWKHFIFYYENIASTLNIPFVSPYFPAFCSYEAMRIALANEKEIGVEVWWVISRVRIRKLWFSGVLLLCHGHWKHLEVQVIQLWDIESSSAWVPDWVGGTELLAQPNRIGSPNNSYTLLNLSNILEIFYYCSITSPTPLIKHI